MSFANPMKTLVTVVLLGYLSGYIDGRRCAVGIQYLDENIRGDGGFFYPSFSQSVFTIDMSNGQKYHYTTETNNGTSYYAACALVADTMTLYAVNWINFDFNAYNIITEEETFIAKLSLNFNGMDYNPFDGLFYGHLFEYQPSFYTLNLTTLEFKFIGRSQYYFSRSVQVSKDGQYLYYTGEHRNVVRAPINNLTFANEEIVIPSSTLSLLSGTPDSSDWFNDDPNDLRYVICFFTSNPPCWVFDLSQPNPLPELLFISSDGDTISGFEILPGQYDNCDNITTPIDGTFPPTVDLSAPTMPSVDATLPPTVDLTVPTPTADSSVPAPTVDTMEDENLPNSINFDNQYIIYGNGNNIINNNYFNSDIDYDDIVQCACFDINDILYSSNKCYISYMGGEIIKTVSDTSDTYEYTIDFDEHSCKCYKNSHLIIQEKSIPDQVFAICMNSLAHITLNECPSNANVATIRALNDMSYILSGKKGTILQISLIAASLITIFITLMFCIALVRHVRNKSCFNRFKYTSINTSQNEFTSEDANTV